MLMLCYISALNSVTFITYRQWKWQQTILCELWSLGFCLNAQYPVFTVGLKAQKYTEESDRWRFWIVSVVLLAAESNWDWNLLLGKSLELLPFPKLCLTNIYSGGKLLVCLYHSRAGIVSVVSYSQFRVTASPV